jgi:hypothetical protein
MWTDKAFEQWGDFYLLIGTAGATLVALLFVAVSLGTRFLTEERSSSRMTQAFFSPVVIHFAAVLAISATALISAQRAVFYAVLIAICAVTGAMVSAYTAIQLLRNRWTNYLQDHFGYGLLPLACYFVLLLAAWMIFTQHAAARDVLAISLLALLVINIRNAWDLILAIVRRQTDRERQTRKNENN